MTTALECTCSPLVGPDGEGISPLCPQHGDQRDTSVAELPAWPLLVAMPLEELWDCLTLAKRDVADARERQGRVEQELLRRVQAARPDFGPESGGGADLAGDTAVVTLTYSRDYEYDEQAILALVAQKHVSSTEFNELVKYQPKVNWTVFNRLLKRGGMVAHLLQLSRTLKSYRPQFAIKGRE